MSEVTQETTTSALARIEHEVHMITTDMSAADVLAIREMFYAAKARMKEMENQLESFIKEWIRANGPLSFNAAGGERVGWYLGEDKSTKCKDPGVTFMALLEATGGDVAKITECLSSNAFKYGAMRNLFTQVLGDEAGAKRWDDCFEIKTKDTLEEGGEKQLKKFDGRFSR
jgi:hypothetical protein